MARDPGLLLVISGPSGVGKTTIVKALRDRFADSVFSVSATTRAPAPGETDGVDYHFIAPQEFDRRVRAGDFLEHAVYAGNQYGTLRAPVEEELANGRLMILDIDVQGGRQVKRRMPDAFSMFVFPPDERELLRRLRDRKRESEEAIQRRFAASKEEIEQARSSGAYDVFLVNDELPRAVEEAVRLVREERARRAGAEA